MRLSIIQTTSAITSIRHYKVIDGIAFVGVGGALPFAGAYVYSEDELEAILSTTAERLPQDIPQILVCHQPPYGTLNDRLYDGRQIGSQTVKQYIEAQQPLICFTGHIHEAIGIDTIGQTQICNPGPVWKGYATAEIVDGNVNTLDIQSIV
jgi:Icc-related predicted phosphoesterase